MMLYSLNKYAVSHSFPAASPGWRRFIFENNNRCRGRYHEPVSKTKIAVFNINPDRLLYSRCSSSMHPGSFVVGMKFLPFLRELSGFSKILKRYRSGLKILPNLRFLLDLSRLSDILISSLEKNRDFVPTWDEIGRASCRERV